mmetsp:Transcript_17740/g.25036  ORF Transcript_17740/g.25036 Transcript_17740/m.25036 type:complete len:896 (+) Transcript_17740:104-2791(+)|eukprot:CAMPEP_0184861436 /NCGR_PEP_ID=MMETSP0580-20130426/6124_1 /TAXON_ID=1118495 /ORGANISM="Dactyliosolen fragilissimus" /LENGTH=895 /DNA_ID=CAMNT_0027358935 /DNA_START=9 /DNA_END=2696 /DNA_ORIENTATION=+
MKEICAPNKYILLPALVPIRDGKPIIECMDPFQCTPSIIPSENTTTTSTTTTTCHDENRKKLSKLQSLFPPYIPLPMMEISSDSSDDNDSNKDPKIQSITIGRASLMLTTASACSCLAFDLQKNNSSSSKTTTSSSSLGNNKVKGKKRPLPRPTCPICKHLESLTVAYVSRNLLQITLDMELSSGANNINSANGDSTRHEERLQTFEWEVHLIGRNAHALVRIDGKQVSLSPKEKIDNKHLPQGENGCVGGGKGINNVCIDTLKGADNNNNNNDYKQKPCVKIKIGSLLDVSYRQMTDNFDKGKTCNHIDPVHNKEKKKFEQEALQFQVMMVKGLKRRKKVKHLLNNKKHISSLETSEILKKENIQKNLLEIPDKEIGCGDTGTSFEPKCKEKVEFNALCTDQNEYNAHKDVHHKDKSNGLEMSPQQIQHDQDKTNIQVIDHTNTNFEGDNTICNVEKDQHHVYETIRTSKETNNTSLEVDEISDEEETQLPDGVEGINKKSDFIVINHSKDTSSINPRDISSDDVRYVENIKINMYLLNRGKSMSMGRVQILSSTAINKGIEVMQNFDRQNLPSILVVDANLSIESLCSALSYQDVDHMAESFEQSDIKIVKPDWVVWATKDNLFHVPTLEFCWPGSYELKQRYKPPCEKKRPHDMPLASFNDISSSGWIKRSKKEHQFLPVATIKASEAGGEIISRLLQQQTNVGSTHNFHKSNLELSKQFRQLSDLFKECTLQDSDEWRSYSYHIVSGRLKYLKFEVSKDIESLRRLGRVKGFGPKVMSLCSEYLETGKLQLIKELENDSLRRNMRNMIRIWGVGPKKAAELVKSGYASIDDVRIALKSRSLVLSENAMIGVKYYEDFLEKMTRNEAKRIGDIVQKTYLQIYPDAEIELVCL